MRLVRKSVAAATAAALCATLPAFAQPTITSYSFADRQVAPSEPLRIVFSAPVTERLAVFIDQQDVSGVLRVAQADVVYPSDELALPAGDHMVTIYRLTAENTWADVARLPLRVAPPSERMLERVTPPSPIGPATTQLSSAVPLGFVPKVDITGQVGRTKTQAAGAETEVDIETAGLQGGVNLSGAWGKVRLSAQANFAGSSVRSQALQFGRRAADAQKVDLASYLVEGEYADTKVTLGHVSFGQHPMLATGLSHRGVTVSHKYSERIDGAFSVQHGSTIVGATRLLGIYDEDHHFVSAMLGTEFFPARPRHLRLELTALQAEIKPSNPSVNASQILAAEQSKGFGVRVLAADPTERVRGDFLYAHSRFSNAPDALTGIATTTRRHAYSLDGTVMALRNWQWTTAQGAWPVNLSFVLKHEYAEPLYRSLGAGWGADYRQTVAAANAAWGPVSSQLSFTRRSDNVDEIPTILTNEVESATFSLAVPLAAVFAGAATNPWIPTAMLTLQRVDQHGSKAPPSYLPEQVPDIITTTQGASFTWNFQRVSFTAGITRNLQDNRAPGAEARDLRTLSQNFNVSWRARDDLSFNAGYGPSRNFAGDVAITRNTRNPQFGFSWTGPNGWSISGNYNYDRSFDSAQTASLRGYGFSTVIGKTLSIPTFWGKPIPGQVQLRHFITHSASRTALPAGAALDATQRTSGVLLAVSFNPF